MLKIGVIAEGITDQAVLDHILKGFFGEDAISVQFLQPMQDATQRSQSPYAGKQEGG